jgi:hypothetical protein
VACSRRAPIGANRAAGRTRGSQGDAAASVLHGRTRGHQRSSASSSPATGAAGEFSLDLDKQPVSRHLEDARNSATGYLPRKGCPRLTSRATAAALRSRCR